MADDDTRWMRRALQLARRARGLTSPNPLVGAVLVRQGRLLGQGWHHRAGLPHAEIVALADAHRRGHDPRGATLYVTLEPCSTRGRTPPCTDALRAARVRRVVVGAIDPNPRHQGRAFRLLRRAGIAVISGVCAEPCTRLNEAFNHWITHHTPFVVVKAAMTLDGKIATISHQSRWITSPAARRHAQLLRLDADAILVGRQTILHDNPALTLRHAASGRFPTLKLLRRIVLDSHARTPLSARILQDDADHPTTIVVTRQAPPRRVAALGRRAHVLVAPVHNGRVDLAWLLRRLGREGITSLLVEGGGETQAAFLLGGHAQRVAFYYAPGILGGRDAPRAVAGVGARHRTELVHLCDLETRRVGPDLFFTARVAPR